MVRVKVKMKKDALGQDVGESGSALPIKKYHKGEEYSLGLSLAKTLSEMGSCEYVSSEPKKEKKKEDKKPSKKKKDKVKKREDKSLGLKK